MAFECPILEDGPSVWTGIDYLARFNCGEKVELGAAVIVIGGGNTAIDAARSARRTGAEQVNFDHKPQSPAVKSPRLPGDERVAKGKAEVAGTISESQFLQEVERCFSCGSCMGCEQCSMYCTLACHTKLEEVGPSMYFTLTLDACKDCGKCIEVCPCGFLEAS